MQQTFKHICIFFCFLVAVALWKSAEPTVADLVGEVVPRSWRAGIVLFLWATLVVVWWHLLFHYLGRMNDKVVYVVSAVTVVAALFGYGVIDV